MSVAANIANLKWARQSSGAAGTIVADGSSVFGAYLTGGTQVAPVRTDLPFEETTALRMQSDRFVSQIHAGGEPEHYVMPAMIGSILYGVLGAVSTSGSGDPYTHVITPATTLPFWTVWRSLGALVFERFQDCKMTKVVIHGETGQPLKVTVTWTGLKAEFKSAAEAGASIEVTNRVLYYDGIGALLLEGAAVPSIDNFDLTIENNGTAIGGDSVFPIDISEGQLQVSLVIRKLFLTTSLRNRLYYNAASPTTNDDAAAIVQELAGSPAGVQFTFTRSASRTLRIAIPRMAIVPYDLQPSVNATDVLREGITFEALQASDLSAPITATVLNARATVY